MHIETGAHFGLMHKSWGEFESKLDNKDIKTKDYI